MIYSEDLPQCCGRDERRQHPGRWLRLSPTHWLLEGAYCQPVSGGLVGGAGLQCHGPGRYSSNAAAWGGALANTHMVSTVTASRLPLADSRLGQPGSLGPARMPAGTARQLYAASIWNLGSLLNSTKNCCITPLIYSTTITLYISAI